MTTFYEDCDDCIDSTLPFTHYIQKSNLLCTCTICMSLISPAMTSYMHGAYLWVHDDVIKWKHIPRYWPFLRGIHRSPVNSPHKGQWRGPLMFTLVCVWINDWVNNREAVDLRCYRTHYDVTLMLCLIYARLFPADTSRNNDVIITDCLVGFVWNFILDVDNFLTLQHVSTVYVTISCLHCKIPGCCPLWCHEWWQSVAMIGTCHRRWNLCWQKATYKGQSWPRKNVGYL